MTAMLKPPVQMVRDLGWRQVLGLDQADDGFWAEVRGQQLAQLARNVPFNLSLLTVNLSAVQVEEANLPDVIAAALARHQIGPERLELEITESLFLAEKPAVIEVLARLTAMGVSFALDDFGTGYSALGTLQKPVSAASRSIAALWRGPRRWAMKPAPLSRPSCG
jgi:hypothetical protein